MWWLFWVGMLLLTSAIVFFVVHLLVCIADLESDANPIDMCHSVNRWVMVEIGLHILMNTCVIVAGYWVEALLLLPLSVYHILTVTRKQQYLDPTQIFRTMTKHRYIATAKLVFYLLFFFLALFRFVFALVEHLDDGDDDKHRRSPFIKSAGRPVSL